MFKRSNLRVLQSGNAFLALDSLCSSSTDNTEKTDNYILSVCKRFQVGCVISEDSFLSENSASFKCSEKLQLFITVFNHLPIQLLSKSGDSIKHKILYAIQTSGSTGQPKIVHVPSSAIMPNIVDFTNRFGLSSADTVLFSTQLLFDPSVVEMFLAMYLGCELLIPISFSQPQSVFIEELITHCDISFLQIFFTFFFSLTPAHLQRFSRNSLQNLFGPRSRVKFILIGGDAFPTNLVNLYRSQHHSIRIFNVYGVTEVSCWSSCYELKEFPCPQMVPIGEPLIGTQIDVTEKGLVAIYGRKCPVDFMLESTNCSFTEDVAFVEVDRFGKKRIYVKGRDKPNSVLPSYEIETLVCAHYEQIIFAKAVFEDRCSFLFLNSIDQTFLVEDDELKKQIPKHLWPTRKIDTKKLIAHARSRLYSQCTDNVTTFLRKSYNIELNEDKLSYSLRNLGLGSLEFAELAFFMEGNLHNHNKMKSTELLQLLLDEKTLLKDLVNILENVPLCQAVSSIPSCSMSTIPIYISRADVATIQLDWSSNLGKCIDGSPLISSGNVYANSHAGIFRCFDCVTGNILLDYKSEACAFEATCSISANFIALGGLNGDLLVFDRKTYSLREILRTRGEIRMTPVFDSSETLFCGSYDGYFYVRNFAGNISTRFDVSAALNRGAMRSSPLVCANSIVIATLGGHVLALKKTSGETVWCDKVDGPVFANVVQIYDVNLCCVVTVQGHVNLFSMEDGKRAIETYDKSDIYLANLSRSIKAAMKSIAFECEHSELQLGETVFSAPVSFRQSHLLLSGGYGVIFLLQFTSHLVLLKRFQLAEAKIVRSPVVLGEFIFAITVQVLYKIRASDMLKSCSFLPCTSVVDIKEETFGSPAILKISEKKYRVLIGSRRDLLRCFLVEFE